MIFCGVKSYNQQLRYTHNPQKSMRNQWTRSLNDFPRGTGWRRSLHGSFVFAILYDRQLYNMEWLQSPQQENEDIPNCPWRVTKWRKRNCKTLWKRKFPKRNWASSTSSSGEQTQSVMSRNRALNISKLNPEMINGSLCVVVCTLPATGFCQSLATLLPLSFASVIMFMVI